MKINPVIPITFQYKSILKTYFLKDKLSTVKKGFYGGILTKENVTLEHLLPHSKKGVTELHNLVLSQDINNWKRGSEPLLKYYNPNNFEQYCEQFKGIKLPYFNGDNYIEQITKTIERLLRQGQ